MFLDAKNLNTSALPRLKKTRPQQSVLTSCLLMHDIQSGLISTFFFFFPHVSFSYLPRVFFFKSLISFFFLSNSKSPLPHYSPTPPPPPPPTHTTHPPTMDKLTPLLMNFIEQSARPPVQAKVSEQLNSTTTDLKSSLPTTVMNYLTGSSEDGSGNAVLSQLVNSLGPSFTNALSSVTGSTIDTASDGMDTLLTNGILNIAKGVLTKSAGQEGEQGGGFNFDFLSQGKEGMVNATLAASAPVIKQVSDNMGAKISNHFPQEIGQALQQLVDQKGGSGGAMGMAAGLMSQFLGGGGGGERAQGGEGGGGSIQQMLQNFLGPKILQLIQPYLQKFEAQMVRKKKWFSHKQIFFSLDVHQSGLTMFLYFYFNL